MRFNLVHFKQEVQHAIKFEKVYVKNRGHAVAQLVEALRYKSEGRGFDSR